MLLAVPEAVLCLKKVEEHQFCGALLKERTVHAGWLNVIECTVTANL